LRIEMEKSGSSAFDPVTGHIPFVRFCKAKFIATEMKTDLIYPVPPPWPKMLPEISG
jgi:hypothetical protein